MGESYEKELKQYRADQLKRHEIAGRKAFRDDINRINDQVFDPIRALKTDGWWEGMLEQAAYMAPEALGTVGMAALPGGWVPLAIKTQADTHRDLRHFLIDHQVEEGRANEIAGKFSLALTVPTLALDRLKAAGMMRQLPFFEAAMKSSTGRITNGALRFASEAGLRGAAMAGSNMLQEPLPELAKEAMHALQKDLPGADWERFFSGYWTRQASTMAVMLPLAAASGAAGRTASRMEETMRVKYLMSRSDTELVALGIHLEHVKALRAAGEDLSLAGIALSDGLKNLDPRGPTAKAATRLLELDSEDKLLNARHGKDQEQWATGPQRQQPEQQQEARGKRTTRMGVRRNSPRDWREIRDLWDQLGYGEILSPANRKQIADDLSPVVDETWVEFHPEDAGLLGEKIVIAHIGGLPITIALPEKRHGNSHSPGETRYNPGAVGSQLPIYPRRPPTSDD